MAYTDKNFKSGKELKEAFANGATLAVWQPGPFGPAVRDGETVIEGPHYPAPHKFYVAVTVAAGVIVAVKGVKRNINLEVAQAVMNGDW